MKKIKLAIIVLAGTFCVNAQTYHPFLNKTDWYCIQVGLISSKYNWYRSTNDSVIGGNTYKTIVLNGGFKQYVREDIATKKIYLRNVAKNSDEILYDFSLTINQSYTPAGGFGFSVTLKSIDSISTLAGYRKRYTYENSFAISVEVIEGVGSIEEPFLFSNWGFDPVYYLVCSYENKSKVYMNPMGYNCASDTFNTGITSESVSEKPIVLYPNPANSVITVESSTKIDAAEVCDMLGKTVLRTMLPAGISELNISSLSSGVFYIKSKAGVLGKFVVY